MSNFYVTTSLPYANAEPHIGTAFEFILADVIARYHRQQKDKVLYSSGTDEHGSKIAETAAKLNLAPENFVNQTSLTFRDAHAVIGSEPDKFIRTTDEAHQKSAQAIWQKLQATDNIYKNTYKGWYCVGCEEFVTDTEVKANHNICPIHQRSYEQLEEENYFLKLSKYAARIEEAIKTDKLKIIPESRKNEILGVFKKGLEDISISRPTEKLSWGIAVPGDKTQVMYVWFEALLNYITVLNYPDGQDFKDFWPANIQVLGKDILRFHAAIWPGILLALGLSLPQTLFVHGFVTIGDQKVSKSLGTAVSPRQVVEKYGQDALRYYLLRHIPSTEDGDFTWAKFESAYNNELANELGNLVQRVASMVTRYQQGIIGEVPESSHDMQAYQEAIDEFRFDRALDYVWGLVKGVNKYLEQTQPWELAKKGDETHLRDVLAEATSDILQIADALEPFLPKAATTIKEIFHRGVVREYNGVLFPKIEEFANPKG